MYKIYHDDFDPYADEPAVFSVVDSESGRVRHRIPIPTQKIGRFVSSVEWLDERYVLVRGEAVFVAIIDTMEGRLTASFHGSEVVVSEDRSRLAFRLPRLPLRGPRPPLETDHVGIAWRADGPEGVWKTAVVFPRSAPLDSFQATEAPTESDRHLLEGPLVWLEQGHSLAFAERHGAGRWLVVLDLPGGEGESPARRHWKLTAGLGEVTDLEWDSERRSFKVTRSKGGDMIETDEPSVE